MLIKGYNLVSINVIPKLQEDGQDRLDPDWNNNPRKTILTNLDKLKKIRENLRELYHTEFLNTLIGQAINVKDRYRPVKHNEVRVGDIVLLKDPLLKPNNYPMAVVKSIQKNVNNEVTGVIAFKGKTEETVKRHVSSVIPLLSLTDDLPNQILENEKQSLAECPNPSKPKRKAAIQCQNNWHNQL
jgi:hypothetical protein